MKTIKNIYSRFAEIVCERDFQGGWRAVCRRLGVSPSTLDEILIKEIGMCGEELLDAISLKD